MLPDVALICFSGDICTENPMVNHPKKKNTGFHGFLPNSKPKSTVFWGGILLKDPANRTKVAVAFPLSYMISGDARGGFQALGILWFGKAQPTKLSSWSR